MTYSEQLEREAGQTRAQVERTLEELRARMSPGQVVDQLVDYARDGGATTFFRNLGRRTVENPLPVAVIGAGLAWLMIANGREHRDRRLGYYDVRGAGELGTGRMATGAGRSPDLGEPSLGERASSIAGDVSHKAGDAAESVSDTARAAGAAVGDMARRVSEGAHSTTSSLGHRASSAYSGASSGIRRATSTIAHSASHLGHGTRSFVDFCKDQPLLLAGLGLAVGAAIGAVFPATEVEQRLAGNQRSDQRNEAKWRLAHMGSGTEETEHIEEVSPTGTTNGSGERRHEGELGRPAASI